MRLLVVMCAVVFVSFAFGQGKQSLSDLQKCQAANKAMYAVGVENEGKIDKLQKDNQQWQEWYDENWAPMKAENDKLHAENSQIALRIFLLFAGIGAGLAFAWAALKAIRRWWPMSKTRRVLITLLLMAAWVSVAAAVGLSDARLSAHPVNLVSSVFVYSLPALTFGSVAVWWFGRTKPEILW